MACYRQVLGAAAPRHRVSQSSSFEGLDRCEHLLSPPQWLWSYSSPGVAATSRYRYDDHDDHDDDNFTVENIHDDVLAHTTIDAKSSTGARFCTFVCATTNDQSA